MTERLPNNEIGYNKSDIKKLYEMNRTAEIIIDTTVGKTESFSGPTLY